MKSDYLKTIQVTCKGEVAAGVLAIDQDVFVLGNTSRGIFLETSSRWLVFLSYEGFRSPLTVTLAEIPVSLAEMKPKLDGKIVSGMLEFLNINLRIATKSGQVWQTAPPKATALPKSERLVKLTQCAGIVQREKPGVGLSPLLAELFQLPEVPHSNRRTGLPPQLDVSAIQRGITNQEPDQFMQAVSSFLGAGSGLTPSGDDFLTGLLLALNRWEAVLWPADNLRETNHLVVESAYHKTTRLSANLIELATLGKGDERLIGMVDQLMGNTPIEPGTVLDLLGWGSSSGVDALVGMAVALTA
jgi:hypothetical protein